MSKTLETTHAVAKINNVEIIVIKNGDDLVPIKPICDALGIASNKQIERIKDDEILSSTSTLWVSVGADQKNREMFCIPFKFVFGWLFTIDAGKVKSAAREAVLKYQLECYNALYEHFVGPRKFLEMKEKATEKLILQQKDDRKNFRESREKLQKTTEELEKLVCTTYWEYLDNNRQLTIPFPESGGAL